MKQRLQKTVLTKFTNEVGKEKGSDGGGGGDGGGGDNADDKGAGG